MLELVVVDGKDGLVGFAGIIRIGGNLVFRVAISLVIACLVAVFQFREESVVGLLTGSSAQLDEASPDSTACLVDNAAVFLVICIGEVLNGLAVNLVFVQPVNSCVNGLLQLLRRFVDGHEVGEQVGRLVSADRRQLVGASFSRQEGDGVVLCAPCRRGSVVIHLTLDNHIDGTFERLFALFACGLIGDISEIAFVRCNLLQQFHHVGYQVVVEGDVVLIAAIARQRPVLRPSATTLLSCEDHVQSLCERLFILLHFGALVHFGQEAHLLSRSTIVKTRVLRFVAIFTYIVELDVLHPATTVLLCCQYLVGNLLSLIAAIPAGTHPASANVCPLHGRCTLCEAIHP